MVTFLLSFIVTPWDGITIIHLLQMRALRFKRVKDNFPKVSERGGARIHILTWTSESPDSWIYQPVQCSPNFPSLSQQSCSSSSKFMNIKVLDSVYFRNLSKLTTMLHESYYHLTYIDKRTKTYEMEDIYLRSNHMANKAPELTYKPQSQTKSKFYKFW